jgi:signal transduction histidine kinase
VRRRLTLLVAATTSVVLLAFLLPFAAFIGDVAENRALDRALLAAQSLSGVVASGDSDLIGTELERARFEGFAVTVYLADGAEVGTRAPRDASIDDVVDGARTVIVDSAGGGKDVLQPVFTDEGDHVIRVAVSERQLSDGVERSRALLLALGLVLFVGSLLVADRLARSLTRPLDDLRGAAEQLAHGDLDTRVEPAGTAETREVGEAMNRLAGRIGELLAAEREQVADISHRLRTPVTVLRLDAESLRDPDERARITADVDEMTRHIDDVIREARRVQREGGRAACDATVVTRERVTFWAALAEDQHRALEVHLPEGECPVRLAADDLAVALDALLGNAVAHTPDGTSVRVTLAPQADGWSTLDVEDSGPGLPFQGAPARGDSRAGSTGLGLDIVRRTALASGGDLEAGRSADLGGAALRMRLGPPDRRQPARPDA